MAFSSIPRLAAISLTRSDAILYQYHTPKRMREQYLGPYIYPANLDFDRHGETLVSSEGCLKAIVEDTYFKELVEKDEAKVIGRVGYKDVWVQDRKAIHHR